MKREEPVGHARIAGELGGLVREPERFLTQSNHAPFAGHRVELARADPEQDQGDRAESDQPRRVGRRRRGRTFFPGRPAPIDRRGPFTEIPGGHRTDHRRELMAVPRRL